MTPVVKAATKGKQTDRRNRRRPYFDDVAIFQDSPALER
jgi:hypothetical protein